MAEEVDSENVYQQILEALKSDPENKELQLLRDELATLHEMATGKQLEQVAEEYETDTSDDDMFSTEKKYRKKKKVELDIPNPDQPPSTNNLNNNTISQNQSSPESEKESVYRQMEEYQVVVKNYSNESILPRDCKSFLEFHLEDSLLKNIAKCGYLRPTPIQRVGIFVALEGRDVQGSARTGSGKTGAYL